MKIALFADSYFPYLSGVSVAVNTLFEDLQKLGHTVLLVVPNYPNAHAEPNIFRVPSLPSPYPNFRLALPFGQKLKKRIENFAPDIIHSHSPFQMGIYAQKTAKKLKIPCVYTLHTLFEEYVHYVPLVGKLHLARLLRNHLRKYCASCATVITPSPQTQDYFLSLKAPTPSMILPTGINLAMARAHNGSGIRVRYQISPDAFLLVYSGRLAKEKNLPFLFGVMSRLVQKNYDGQKIYLLVVANGPEEKNLQRLAAQLGLSEQIIFTHGVPHAEVFDCCAAGDVFIFASKTETQGLVIAEAKVKGLPAVAVAAEGVSASIYDKEDGFLVPEDENIFVEKVWQLWRNPTLRRQMGERARINGENHFSSLAIAQKVKTLYKDLCYTFLR